MGNLASDQPLVVYKVPMLFHTSYITALCFSSYGYRLISGCEGGIAVENTHIAVTFTLEKYDVKRKN